MTCTLLASTKGPNQAGQNEAEGKVVLSSDVGDGKCEFPDLIGSVIICHSGLHTYFFPPFLSFFLSYKFVYRS